MTAPLFFRTLSTPLGTIRLIATDAGLTHLELPGEHGAARVGGPAAEPEPEGAPHPVLEQAARELTEYFAGVRRTFSVPLAAAGTAFQQEVWAALCQIPFGTTWSYADVARTIGRPNAVRAVGAANGRNPIAIIVPCHRVIGADGTLTGYGGGLPTKEWLLAHEGVARPTPRQLSLV